MAGSPEKRMRGARAMTSSGGLCCLERFLGWVFTQKIGDGGVDLGGEGAKG